MSLLLLGVSRPEISFVLDVVGVGAEVAYGFRKLRAAYTGSAFRVREAGGNTETDIGFLANGDLDTTALSNFCGISNGYVVTWYDQSGNGRNVTQSTAANQPIIFNPANPDPVYLLGGKPTARFDGTDFLTRASFSMVEQSVNTVFKLNSTAGTQTLIRQNNTVSGVEWALRMTGGAYQYYRIPTINAPTGAAGTTAHVATALASNGSNAQIFQDGASVITYTAMSTTATDGILSVGANPVGAELFIGDMPEVLTFATNLTTTQRQTLERNQGAYFGITVA
jgi:hypothetical protein